MSRVSQRLRDLHQSWIAEGQGHLRPRPAESTHYRQGIREIRDLEIAVILSDLEKQIADLRGLVERIERLTENEDE